MHEQVCNLIDVFFSAGFWKAVGSIGSVLAAGVAVWTYRKDKASSRELQKATNLATKHALVSVATSLYEAMDDVRTGIARGKAFQRNSVPVEAGKIMIDEVRRSAARVSAFFTVKLSSLLIVEKRAFDTAWDMQTLLQEIDAHARYWVVNDFNGDLVGDSRNQFDLFFTRLHELLPEFREALESALG